MCRCDLTTRCLLLPSSSSSFSISAQQKCEDKVLPSLIFTCVLIGVRRTKFFSESETESVIIGQLKPKLVEQNSFFPLGNKQQRIHWKEKQNNNKALTRIHLYVLCQLPHTVGPCISCVGSHTGTRCSVLAQREWLSQYGVCPLWYNMHAVCSETLSLYSKVILCKAGWDVLMPEEGHHVSCVVPLRRSIFKLAAGDAAKRLHSL